MGTRVSWDLWEAYKMFSGIICQKSGGQKVYKSLCVLLQVAPGGINSPAI